MVSGCKPPDGEPRGASGSLIRHRWLTAAGTPATVAAMAGGGLVLLRHQPAAGPHRDCGLVPCSATLPRSVTASAASPAASPVRARPAPRPARSPGRAGRHAEAAPAGAGLAAGPGQSADHQVRVHYKIRHLPGGTVTGQLVIVNHGGAPITGWQLRLVLPGDDHYQVGHAASTSAGDSLVVTARPGTRALGAGRSARFTFTAEGSTAVPASITFRDAPASQPAQAGSPAGSPAGQAQSGWPSGSGWPGSWWRGPQQHGFGGWPAPGPGGWPGAGQGGWPGGR
jgi:Cellulose binding domain